MKHSGNRQSPEKTSKSAVDNPLVTIERLHAENEELKILLRDLKQAEEDMRHLASFPQTNPDPVMEVNSSCKVTFYNPGAQKALESLGMDKEDFSTFLPSDIEIILKDLGKKEESFFYRETKIKDRVFGLNIYLTPQYNVARIYAYDITEHKRIASLLQTRLRMSELAQRTGIEGLMQAALDEAELHTGSQIGFFHFVNEDQENLTLQAWSTNTLKNMCKAEGKGLHYPISQAGVWVECFHRRVPVIHNDYATLSHRKGLPKGHVPIVRELVVPILRDGSVVAIIGVGNKPKDYIQQDVDTLQALAMPIMDLVARQQAEEALRREKLFTDAVTETMPGLFFVINQDRRFVQWNRACEELLGFSSEQFGALDVLEPLLEPDREMAARKLREVFETGEAELEARVLGKDGVRVFRFAAKRLILGDEMFIIGNGVDITASKRTDEELRKLAEDLKHSNAELKQFAYAASHDLQEPLRGLAGFAALLEKRYKGKLDKDAGEFIDFIVNDAKRMQELIRDLLEYSQIETKSKILGDTNCSVVLEEAFYNLRSAVEETGAELTYDLLPTVTADASQLKRLFQNLIGNAIKFRGKEKPRIHISAEQKGKEWVFSFKDNGIGFDSQFADRIFVVFQRLHTRREYPGTGIGLAICKKIVEQHGGRIWVESEPRKGSTFYFTLPVRE